MSSGPDPKASPPGPATRLAHAGSREGRAVRATTVAPPLQRGSTLLLPDAAALYDVSRPTYGMNSLASHDALRAGIAELEGALETKLFTSGLAAVAGAVSAVVSSGDEILASAGVYEPTRRFLVKTLSRFGVTTAFFEADASPDDVFSRASPKTRLIVLESPASLTFELQDVPAIAAEARRRGVLTLLDNTWSAGLLFRPLDHGVDLSVQALTKYVCGHSDVFAGAVSVARPDLGETLEAFIRETGASVSPDDAAAGLRGLRTLKVRLDRHGSSALDVARWLKGRSEVREVLFPALEGDRFHDLWRRDFSGPSGLFGVVLDGPPEATAAFLNALKLFGLGFSWGGYESLAVHADPRLRRFGKPLASDGGLVRLNIGLEDPADLIGDLEAGLRAFAAAR